MNSQWVRALYFFSIGHLIHNNELHVLVGSKMKSFKQFLNQIHSLVRYFGAEANQRWIAAAQSLPGKMHIISPKIPSLQIMEIVNTFYPKSYRDTPFDDKTNSTTLGICIFIENAWTEQNQLPFTVCYTFCCLATTHLHTGQALLGLLNWHAHISLTAGLPNFLSKSSSKSWSELHGSEP